MEFKKGKSPSGEPLLENEHGYAILHEGKIWIPAIRAIGQAKEFINAVVKEFKTNKIVFSAVIQPDVIKAHFRNIVREWDEWFPESEDYSHCVEIDWQS